MSEINPKGAKLRVPRFEALRLTNYNYSQFVNYLRAKLGGSYTVEISSVREQKGVSISSSLGFEINADQIIVFNETGGFEICSEASFYKTYELETLGVLV